MRHLAALGLAGLLLAASCSAGPRPPVAVTGRVIDKGNLDDTGLGPQVTVHIDSGDDYFSPTYIKVAPGATVTFDITNVGTIAHTFTIDPVGSTARIDRSFGRKGDHTAATVVAPGPGQALVFYCKYHREAGMQGALSTG